MPPAKSDLHAPPRAWVKLLHNHGDRVVRLRLLWRRGRRPYLPLIPLEDCPPNIYQQVEWKFWEARETQATHFEVKFNPKMSSEARAELISEKLGQVWACSQEWARALGSWCDFALVAYDKQGNVEFRNGKRLISAAKPTQQVASEGGEVPNDGERTPTTGTIEILVGKFVLRVCDRTALRLVLDVLATIDLNSSPNEGPAPEELLPPHLPRPTIVA